MEWRPAKSIATLKNQLDAAYPGWLFLGFIGDQSHQTVASDHNPNSAGVVCAIDIGPGGGLDIHKLADRLLANRHPNLKYIISNGRIAGTWSSWKWQAYTGSDPHDTHIHISVGVGPDGQSRQPYDDTTKWNITGETIVKPTKDEINNAFNLLGVPDATPHPDKNYTYYMSKDRGVLWQNVARELYDREQALKTQLAAEAPVLAPGKYRVN